MNSSVLTSPPRTGVGIATIADEHYTRPPLQALWESLIYLLGHGIQMDTWGERLLHGALTAMSPQATGQLTLIMPDGSEHRYGRLPDDATITGQPQTARAFAPIAEMRVHHPNFFKRLMLYGHVGAAESYMAGEWDTPSIREVIAWFIDNLEHSTLLEGSGHKQQWTNLLGGLNRLIHRLRPNSLRLSQKNIQAHYDLSNTFFALFLDETMAYSSAIYHTGEESLVEAQRQKFDALIQQLRLEQDDHVLEIGSGWGGFAIHAAQTIGCRITTITISQQQYDFAKTRIDAAGVSHLIDLRLQDYRTLEGQFDKIVSIEMVEALGDAYYETFWATCHKVLKRNGLVGIQMITCPDSRYTLLKSNVDFIQKHIFPGSLLPSVSRMTTAMNRVSDLSLFEMTDMGLSYAKTLNVWWQRFNNNLDDVKALGFDETFIRKWNYYLQYCEAAFMTRNISVVQAIYARPNSTCLGRPRPNPQTAAQRGL